MYLERLYIMNYRNVPLAEIMLSPGINCFVGDNGMGKTNILDAIHYLSFCRSSLNPVDSQVMRHGSDCMMLQGAYLMDNGESAQVACSLRSGGRKSFSRDRKEYQRLSDHIGLVPMVWISPGDGELISGVSDGRRKFMDVVISQHDRDYLGKLIDYNKALAQRNALLKSPAVPDSELIQMWENLLCDSAAVIYKRRREFVDNIIPSFQQFYSLIGESGETVGLVYQSHCREQHLADLLRQNREREHIVGHTLYGIHRDELEMTLGGYPIRREGSQGQNKSYLIALKLAQYRYLAEACPGRRPLLLLDDLFDKLDANRVERILEVVSGSGFGQIFITDVNRSHMDAMLSMTGNEYRVFNVVGGEVK